MSLLLHIIVAYIKENIITKLQKLYSPPRNPRAGNKLLTLFVKNPRAKMVREVVLTWDTQFFQNITRKPISVLTHPAKKPSLTLSREFVFRVLLKLDIAKHVFCKIMTKNILLWVWVLKGLKWNEIAFFQHNNVHFTSFNFYKMYMLGKKI